MIFETEDTEKLLIRLLECYNAHEQPGKVLLQSLDDSDTLALLESLIEENFGYDELESWIEEVNGYDLLEEPDLFECTNYKGVIGNETT